MSQEFVDTIKKITPDTYLNLKRGLELGKWPNGEALTAEQKRVCMQAVISYEATHMPDTERTGYMPQACKSGEAPEPTLIPTQEDH